ncbi:MAG: Slp family lipoprotein [Nitrospiraceae bacterium]
MKWKRVFIIGAMMPLIFAAACNRYQVIPDNLRGQVNRNVTFDELQTSAAKHRGELVVLGGEVLSATRLEDKTRIEVLQLPLNDDLMPTSERPQSKGRFIAFDGGKDIVDPAVLREGTPVTIIGEVQPSARGALGESEYKYPVLAIRDMTVWDATSMRVRPYPSGGSYPYYGAGYRPYHFMSGAHVSR